MNQNTLLAALGGALVCYGIMQKLKAKNTDEILAKSINQSEGWIGIGVGALLVIAALY